MIDYKDLELFFTAPKIKPHYKRIPRKLKKSVKKYVGCHYIGMNINSIMWHFMETKTPDYKRFLIKEIYKTYEKTINLIYPH